VQQLAQRLDVLHPGLTNAQLAGTETTLLLRRDEP
jgi:hypothetical protein